MRNLIRHYLLRLLTFLVSLLPSAVDRIVATLVGAAARLEALEGKMLDFATRETELISSSYDRQAAFAAKERAVRAASEARINTLVSEASRAARVRNRIAGLLA